MKLVEFCGSSLKDLRLFPEGAKRDAGYQIDRVQNGLMPDDWKPMSSVGKGVNEIRVMDDDGIYRVLYVAQLGNKVYVLHCFQKKTQKTAKRDLDLGKKRYQVLLEELNR